MAKSGYIKDPAIEQEVTKAAEVIKRGGVILYPTDTIWGIGCDATNYNAVAKVFEIKQRQESKSLVTLVCNLDMLALYVKEIPDAALQLIEINDSPMTIIYPAVCNLAENVVAKDGSAAIRIPMSEFCRQLCYRLKRPIVSTSANLSGESSPKSFSEISSQIKERVEHIVSPTMEHHSTGKASQIIRVGVNSEIEIIRR